MKNLSIFDRKFLRICHVQAEGRQHWSDELFLKSCGIAPLNYIVTDGNSRLMATFQQQHGEEFSKFMRARRENDIERMLEQFTTEDLAAKVLAYVQSMTEEEKAEVRKYLDQQLKKNPDEEDES